MAENQNLTNPHDIIHDPVIYGEVDHLVCPQLVSQSADSWIHDEGGEKYQGVVFVKDRYINNILIDCGATRYTEYIPNGFNNSSWDWQYSENLQLNVILPYDVTQEEHYYIHFLSLNTTTTINSGDNSKNDQQSRLMQNPAFRSEPGIQTYADKINARFLIESPAEADYNKHVPWQLRKYIAVTNSNFVNNLDLYLFLKPINPDIRASQSGIFIKHMVKGDCYAF